MVFTWWVKAANCNVAVGDTCEFEVSSGANHVVQYFTAQKRTNTTVKPYTVPAADVAKWKPYVDEEGYLYMRFNTNKYSGAMTVKTDAPAEKDPTYPAATVALACEGTKVMVYVSRPQTVKVFDMAGVKQAEWAAQPGTPHELNLAPGAYMVEGEEEKIAINL